MSTLEVNTIDSVSGTSTLTLGASNATTLALDNSITTTPFAPAISVNQWYYGADISPTNAATVTTLTNWNAADYTNVAIVGSNVTEGGGTFSFATTGIYEIFAQVTYLEYNNNYAGYAGVKIRRTSNNSSYSDIARGYTNMDGGAGSSTYAVVQTKVIIDITDISQQKIQFAYEVATQQKIQGNANETFVIFKKLGDT